MIFLINESNEQLKLKASKQGDATVLSVIVNDFGFPIISTEHPALSDAMFNRFGEPEVIRNKNSKHNFRADNMDTYIAQYPECAEDEEPSGLEGTCKMVCKKHDEKWPEVYTTSKDIVVFVHSRDTLIDIDKKHLTEGKSIQIDDERGEFTVTIMPIRWYNWSKIRGSAIIYVNNEATYELSSMPHPDEGNTRRLNIVRYIRKKSSGNNSADTEK